MTKPAKWKKSEPAIAARFVAALPDHPALQRKTMFGYQASFVNGHFFAGMHEDNIVLRLPADLLGKFPALAGAAIFDPMGTGKGMKDWWRLPPGLAADAAGLSRLLAAACAEIAKLPPKVKKPPKARAKRR